MVSLIIGVFSGAIASWIIAHFYYKKSNHDQNHLFDKLPDYIRQVLLEDQRKKLSVKELNELIRAKTIDRFRKGTQAFKACPRCDSWNIKMGKEEVPGFVQDCEYEVMIPIDSIECQNCNWKKTEYDDLEI